VGGGRLKTLAANLGLALASAAAAVFLIHLAGVLFHLDAGGFFLVPNQRNCLRRDPLLSMSFRPSCDGELSLTPVHTNDLGLRGAEPRDDGSVRVLAAGDSCTWGWRVAENQSYPSVLERMLGEMAIQNRYQVINAGVPGYTSFQGLEYVRERGVRLAPAILIVAYGFNDVFPTGDVEAQIARERAWMTVLRADDFLLNHSPIYRWTRWRAEAAASRRREPRVSVESYARNLRRMVEIGRESGAKVMLLSFWGPYVPEQDYRKALIAVAKDLGVPLVTYEGERIDAVHPTVAGYEDLAKRIANRLIFEAWVQ
jgi:lysophospholipase L1-like esterase